MSLKKDLFSKTYIPFSDDGFIGWVNGLDHDIVVSFAPVDYSVVNIDHSDCSNDDSVIIVDVSDDFIVDTFGSINDSVINLFILMMT